MSRPAHLEWNRYNTSRKAFVSFINIRARLTRYQGGKEAHAKGVRSLGFMLREDGSLCIGMTEKLDRKRAGLQQFTELSMQLSPMEVRALLVKLYQVQVQSIFEDFSDALKGTTSDVFDLEVAA